MTNVIWKAQLFEIGYSKLTRLSSCIAYSKMGKKKTELVLGKK